MKRAFAALYVAALVGLALIHAPLGHDEAQYALGGASLLGHDVSPFPLHRPIGMQVIAAPAVLAGGGELAFRLTAIATTLAFLGAAWLYARRVHGPRVATWTVAVVATSFAILRRGAELLSDAPAGTLMLLFATILVGELAAPPGDRGPAATPDHRWRLAWLGPIAGAAFYIRYGSLGVLAGISVAAAIVWRGRLRACAGPLAAAIALAALSAVPHVLHSLETTGSALGILRAASDAAGRGYVGEGVVFYATWWWAWLGPLGAVCVAIGLLAGATRRDAVAAFAALASLLSILALGMDAHGEARFVLVPEVLLVGAGVDAIIARIRPMPRVAAGLVVTCLIGSAAAGAIGVARAGRTFDVAMRAGAEIRRAAGGARCRVLTGQWTQLEWYSGCAGLVIPDAITPRALEADGPTFLVWFDDGRRQPASALVGLERHATGVRAEKIAHVAGDHTFWGSADVYRLAAIAGSASR